jgi:hypothetical protein
MRPIFRATMAGTPSGVRCLWNIATGGIVRRDGLNHRLMASNPPGSTLSFSVVPSYSMSRRRLKAELRTLFHPRWRA